MTTIDANGSNIPAKYIFALRAGSCDKPETADEQVRCSDKVDSFQKAGQAARVFARGCPRTLAMELEFADWLYLKGGYVFPKVVILADEMLKPEKSPRRVNQLASMALEAARESGDPAERAAGVALVADAYAQLGEPGRAAALVNSLAKR